MIVFACQKCSHSIRTVGEDAEALLGQDSIWWPDRYPCPFCGALTSMSLNAVGVVVDLTPQEAMAAFGGLGLPLERECGELAVKHAFDSMRVKAVHTKMVNRKCCCLESIEFEDGTKLYLGSSFYGAVVYRIAKPHSYTSSVLQEMEKRNA